MNLSAIYHRTNDQFCYALNDDELIINIKTGYDVKRVFIWHGDPYDAGIMGGAERWHGKRLEIPFKKRLKDHIWWTTTVIPEYKRQQYYFELTGDGETYFYFEDGFYTREEIERPGKSFSYFIFPWMNPADIFKTPRWVNDTIWYQIFPERFCNGDESNDPEGVREWKYEPVKEYDSYYGGDIAGMIKRLDYIAGLGITGLYLTPVFEAQSNHKYNTKDYRRVDPHFGTNEELRYFIDLCHKRGIRVMLDGVFNHTGTDIPMWLDVLENGRGSEYFDWYMINELPVEKEGDTRDKRFYSFAFSRHMPKLNTNNPAVIRYLLDIVRFWIEEFDIDGLRLDVGNEISHLFLKELRRMCRGKKDDFYLLGEIWHDATQWLQGDEYDAVMNYPLATAISNYWVYPEWDKAQFEYGVNKSFTTYMQQCNDVLFNLLDSHDTNRLMDKVKDIDVFFQQLAVLYTMPGSPCIFYGTEIAMEGGHDPDCRRCMPWEDIDNGVYDDRIGEIKKLIGLRKAHPEFRSRDFHFPNDVDNRRMVEYIKINENDRIKVLLNCDTVSVRVDIPDGAELLYERKYKKGALDKGGVMIYAFREGA